ncbi:MAG: hypothetical protein HY820_44220 [Acidobacteria bacterium]|nr:hypothetical protein [Acidobacteriota bacterium]
MPTPNCAVSEGGAINETGAVFTAAGMKLALLGRIPLKRSGDGVTADFALQPGESLLE